MKLKQKTLKENFVERGAQEDFDEMHRGASSLVSRASSFQTADSAASSNSQGRCLIECKMSNECEVCQVCRYLSQSDFLS